MEEIDAADVAIDVGALTRLLALEAKLRIVAAVLEEGSDDSQFNPSAIYKYNGVSRDAWYRYHEDLYRELQEIVCEGDDADR